MAINAYGNNIATAGATSTASKQVTNKTTLKKDDFMKLLLVELQHQDPTQPMNSEKILSQTSQLAGLEASSNTNKALSSLSKSLSSSKEFSTIAAIGKTADIGSNTIAHTKGSTSKFEIYYPNDIKNGTVDVLDSNEKVVATLNISIDKSLGKKSSGVYPFTWNGVGSDGIVADSGIYHIKSNYTDTNGVAKTTQLGTYPIEAVRFAKGTSLLKLGSNYVPIEKIKEVY